MKLFTNLLIKMARGRKIASNTQRVILEIIKDPEISQIELAKKTGNSRQRIHQIVKALITQGVMDYEVKSRFILKRLDFVK